MILGIWLFRICTLVLTAFPFVDLVQAEPQTKDLPSLVERLKNPDSKVRSTAAWEMGSIGADAVPWLVEALRDPDRLVRTEAVGALGRIGVAAGNAVPALSEVLLGDTSSSVRQYAVWAIGRTGPAAKGAILALTKALEDKESGVRCAALQELEKVDLPKAARADLSRRWRKWHEEQRDVLLADWKKKFPDCFDYGGAPIKLLAAARVGTDIFPPPLAKFDPKVNWRRIITEYPESKVAPLAAYFLYSNEKNLEALLSDWGHHIFPYVTSAYLDAWGHYPIPGARVGPIAQLFFAQSLYGESEGIPFGGRLNKNSQNVEKSIPEFKKVLEWYPEHLKSTSTILTDEWGRVILIAYEFLLKAYARANRLDELEETARAILKVPDMVFGNNYGGHSHPEALLALTRAAKARGQYETAIGHLVAIEKNYSGSYFGYHGGRGDIYFNTALFEILSFPDEFADRGVEKLSRAARNMDQAVFCYLQRACSLLSSNEQKALGWVRKAQGLSPLHAFAFVRGAYPRMKDCFGYEWELDADPRTKKIREMLTGEDRGMWGGIREEKNVVVTSDKEWRNLWVQHTTGTAQTNFVPAIDFSRFQVVGVFLGSLTTGPDNVGLRVLEKDKEIEVEYIPTLRGASARTDGYDFQPWVLQVIPKTNKLVVFKKKSE